MHSTSQEYNNTINVHNLPRGPGVVTTTLRDTRVLLLFSLLLGERAVMFSDVISKINRKGKTREMWIMITGTCTYIGMNP